MPVWIVSEQAVCAPVVQVVRAALSERKVAGWEIVSVSNAKADLLNEAFINQNTSLAPDAYVFGPSPLNVTFDLGNIYPPDVQR